MLAALAHRGPDDPDFNAHVELVLDIPNEGRPGPARRIFAIKDE